MGFKRSAFRLEVHRTYTTPAGAETVRDFLARASMPKGVQRAMAPDDSRSCGGRANDQA
ncbi:DUF6879 family protein [Streptomyces hokutonensis]|uniref:DUF6879 family protein n=1 Tax=Streptomyces hokutonensis TaxID=1306990 RepID=UPI00382443B6